MDSQPILTSDVQEEADKELKGIIDYPIYLIDKVFEKIYEGIRKSNTRLTKADDQLAKISEKIEQLVLQTQAETDSVMAAIEEDTERAERAKRALDNVIQMSGQIKKLVDSMPKFTSKRIEPSLSASQARQSLESIGEDCWESFDDDIIAGSEHEMTSAERYEFVQKRTYRND
jgi:methyl-accepting chemotaxis protein